MKKVGLSQILLGVVAGLVIGFTLIDRYWGIGLWQIIASITCGTIFGLFVASFKGALKIFANVFIRIADIFMATINYFSIFKKIKINPLFFGVFLKIVITVTVSIPTFILLFYHFCKAFTHNNLNASMVSFGLFILFVFVTFFIVVFFCACFFSIYGKVEKWEALFLSRIWGKCVKVDEKIPLAKKVKELGIWKTEIKILQTNFFTLLSVSGYIFMILFTVIKGILRMIIDFFMYVFAWTILLCLTVILIPFFLIKEIFNSSWALKVAVGVATGILTGCYYQTFLGSNYGTLYGFAYGVGIVIISELLGNLLPKIKIFFMWKNAFSCMRKLRCEYWDF